MYLRLNSRHQQTLLLQQNKVTYTASRTSSTGQTLKEAKYINSSLFFLEMVIVALHNKDTRGTSNKVHGNLVVWILPQTCSLGSLIAYRNSMMTSVLRDSLGGNCKPSPCNTSSLTIRILISRYRIHLLRWR